MNRVTTRAGITIGLRYQPPARPLTPDAETVQRALLDPHARKPLPPHLWVWRRIARWL